jgi:hypothetical protein
MSKLESLKRKVQRAHAHGRNHPRGLEPAGAVPRFAPGLSQVMSRIIGETLIASADPAGFLEGARRRVLELNRARRWKELAKKLRAELRARSHERYQHKCTQGASSSNQTTNQKKEG